MDVGSFTKTRLARGFDQLRALATHPNEARRVPVVLAEMGIRFVVVKHLPKTKIDGAVFWLNAKSPVIAMSLRYGRIDYFWHTLAHELGHIVNNDGLSLDTDLVGKTKVDSEGKPEIERKADDFACSFLVPPDELDDFVFRVKPLYGRKAIIGFAARIGVHPGIVVGQLQYRSEIGYSHSRAMLVDIRESVTTSSLCDGWGEAVLL
jgi:HTH-type transcriptional regulator/antitoxin HigA